jgi:putative membrane protein
MTGVPVANLPDQTKLSVDRTRLSHDRTLMSWVRTSTSLISFGFSIYKFFQYLRDSGGPAARGAAIGPRGLALILIGIGVGSLVVATIEHRRDIRALREQYGVLVPRSLATVTAGLIAGLGLFLFFAVILRL